MKLHKKKVTMPMNPLASITTNKSPQTHLPKNTKQLSDLPMSVLDLIVENLDPQSVLNIRYMNRKLRVAASKRIWSHVTLTNLTTKRPDRNNNKQHQDLRIFINKYTFRTFFEDAYMGRLDDQLTWIKHFNILFKEEDLVTLQKGTTTDTAKNLNYVPIQHFFHWFLKSKAPDFINPETLKMSINIGSNAFADALKTFCWSVPKAHAEAIYWIPKFANVAAKDLITPNLHAIEIKCDLLNFDLGAIFAGDFTVPKKCEIFRLGLEDKLRFEHKLRVIPPRPKIPAEALQRWFRKCINLHTLELAYVDILNPQALDWTPPGFEKTRTAALILDEVEFLPAKQALLLKSVNMLDRINVRTRPLQELLAPNMISLTIAATRASDDQLQQLYHWFKFHRPTLQKITISHMPYSPLFNLLQKLGGPELGFKMIDVINPIPDSTIKFQELAKPCLTFGVLKFHMRHVSIEQGTAFLQYLYTNKSELSSVRIIDGPFTKSTLPKFVLMDPRQFQLIETNPNGHKRVVVFEKSSAPNTPS